MHLTSIFRELSRFTIVQLANIYHNQNWDCLVTSASCWEIILFLLGEKGELLEQEVVILYLALQILLALVSKCYWLTIVLKNRRPQQCKKCLNIFFSWGKFANLHIQCTKCHQTANLQKFHSNTDNGTVLQLYKKARDLTNFEELQIYQPQNYMFVIHFHGPR
jgi:hypothetical protein